MTIVIKDPDVEAMLRRMAEARGLTPEALVAELAKSEAANRGQRLQERLAEFRRQHGLEALEGRPPLPKSFYDELSGE